jgi:microcystin-dependent protein
MPSHNHGINTSNDQAGSGKATVGNSATEGSLNTNNAGSGNPHENRPPFIVTLFIQKI